MLVGPASSQIVTVCQCGMSCRRASTRRGFHDTQSCHRVSSHRPCPPARHAPPGHRERRRSGHCGSGARLRSAERHAPLGRQARGHLQRQEARPAHPVRARPRRKRSTAAAAATPPVGTVRNWLAIDDTQPNAAPYAKPFTLRGVGDKIEVWVANDLSFPAGDCRAQIPNSTTITDAQVAYFVNEFDTVMFPKETEAFSTPPDRDGTNARIPGDYTGDGDKTVALIDNVRDDNFYDFPASPTYIAGFFSAGITERVDRNVMTVDAFDWAHRTDRQPGQRADRTTCAPAARPARTATRARSRTSGSTCSCTTPTRSRGTGSTRASRTSPRP